jgi:chromosome segregation ATPase
MKNAEASFYSIQQEYQQMKERLDTLMSDADHDEAKHVEQNARIAEANQQQKHRIAQLEADILHATGEIDSLLMSMSSLRSGLFLCFYF